MNEMKEIELRYERDEYEIYVWVKPEQLEYDGEEPFELDCVVCYELDEDVLTEFWGSVGTGKIHYEACRDAKCWWHPKDGLIEWFVR